MNRTYDPKRPIIESDLRPWYIKRGLLIGAILATSLMVWCRQAEVREIYERILTPVMPAKKTHQQRERQLLDRDAPQRTPLPGGRGGRG